MSLLQILLVAAGGALGSVGRHAVNVLAVRIAGPDTPWGTLAVNVAGSFVMGGFIALLAVKFGGSQPLRLFVATGILGGFTTLSAFSLDVVTLWERGATLAAASYVLATLVLSITGLVAGLSLARALT